MLSLRERREMLGMTQAELAHRIGVNANHISMIEQGKVKLPDIELRRELARALGIRHIDVLIAQGILDDWELPGFSPDVVPPDPDLEVLIALLGQIDLDRDRRRETLSSLLEMFARQDRERQPAARSSGG